MLGVGSELRGDDFAGVLVARAVEAWRKKAKVEHLAGFEGFSAPENLTGAIARFRPSHVLMVDAAHLGLEPGTVRVLDPEQITGVSFSTHMLPAPIFLGYLSQTTGCRTLVVGIQPTQTDVLGPLSAPVKRAVKAVAQTVCAAFAVRATP
ncbi:MAG: hydrogenase 3 maturation endopeptidase HyCI [Deltaproteobacteria bacterium]|nr:hydrogenase 3 maturation endopeptidase HyCI [Deltaproteobacteria bacterium]